MPGDGPWIEAALAPFPSDDPGNERRRELLLEASLSAPVGWKHADAAEPEVPASFKSTPPRFRRRALAVDVAVALVALLLLWIFALSPAARQRLRDVAVADLTSHTGHGRLTGPLTLLLGKDRELERLDEHLRRRLPADRHALFLGKSGEAEFLDRWQPFWDQHPDDPAVFAERMRVLTPFDPAQRAATLAEAGRVDPGNGYYHYLAAIEASAGAVVYRATPTVHNRAAFDQAWGDLTEAAEAPFLNSRQDALLTRRTENWPPAADYPQLAADLTWAMSIGPSGVLENRGSFYLPKLIEVRTEELRVAGQREDLKRLCHQWRVLLERIYGQPESMGDTRWGEHFVSITAPALEQACRELGLGDEEAFFQSAGSRIGRPSYTAGPSRGSRISDWMRWDFPMLDLAPARLAEYAMFEAHFLGLAVLAVLLILALVAAIRGFAGQETERLPARLAGALRPVDHLFAIVVGIGLPLAVLLVTWKTPALQPSDEAIGPEQAGALLLKLASFVVSVPLLLTWVLSRRLAARAAPLGFAPLAPLALPFLALLAIAASAVACLLARLHDIPHVGNDDQPWWAAFAMLGCIVLVWIGALSMLAFGGQRRLPVLTLMRSITPALLLTALVLAGLAFEARTRERTWVARFDLASVGAPSAAAILAARTPAEQELPRRIARLLAEAPPGPDEE